jgi:hypothetical protein
MATAYLKYPDGNIIATSHPEYHNEATRLSAKEGAAAYRAQCAEELRKMVKPGQTVYTILRHVSASGMSRRISLVIVSGAEIHKLDHLAAGAMGDTLHKDGGIVVSGCGMDMGFHLVYDLGRTLWPKGTRKPHGTRNGQPDRDGGYALKHEWL